MTLKTSPEVRKIINEAGGSIKIVENSDGTIFFWDISTTSAFLYKEYGPAGHNILLGQISRLQKEMEKCGGVATLVFDPLHKIIGKVDRAIIDGEVQDLYALIIAACKLKNKGCSDEVFQKALAKATAKQSEHLARAQSASLPYRDQYGQELYFMLLSLQEMGLLQRIILLLSPHSADEVFLQLAQYYSKSTLLKRQSQKNIEDCGGLVFTNPRSLLTALKNAKEPITVKSITNALDVVTGTTETFSSAVYAQTTDRSLIIRCGNHSIPIVTSFFPSDHGRVASILDPASVLEALVEKEFPISGAAGLYSGMEIGGDFAGNQSGFDIGFGGVTKRIEKNAELNGGQFDFQQVVDDLMKGNNAKKMIESLKNTKLDGFIQHQHFQGILPALGLPAFGGIQYALAAMATDLAREVIESHGLPLPSREEGRAGVTVGVATINPKITIQLLESIKSSKFLASKGFVIPDDVATYNENQLAVIVFDLCLLFEFIHSSFPRLGEHYPIAYSVPELLKQLPSEWIDVNRERLQSSIKQFSGMECFIKRDGKLSCGVDLQSLRRQIRTNIKYGGDEEFEFHELQLKEGKELQRELMALGVSNELVGDVLHKGAYSIRKIKDKSLVGVEVEDSDDSDDEVSSYSPSATASSVGTTHYGRQSQSITVDRTPSTFIQNQTTTFQEEVKKLLMSEFIKRKGVLFCPQLESSELKEIVSKFTENSSENSEWRELSTGLSTIFFNLPLDTTSVTAKGVIAIVGPGRTGLVKLLRLIKINFTSPAAEKSAKLPNILSSGMASVPLFVALAIGPRKIIAKCLNWRGEKSSRLRLGLVDLEENYGNGLIDQIFSGESQDPNSLALAMAVATINIPSKHPGAGFAPILSLYELLGRINESPEIDLVKIGKGGNIDWGHYNSEAEKLLLSSPASVSPSSTTNSPSIRSNSNDSNISSLQVSTSPPSFVQSRATRSNLPSPPVAIASTSQLKRLSSTQLKFKSDAATLLDGPPHKSNPHGAGSSKGDRDNFAAGTRRIGKYDQENSFPYIKRMFELDPDGPEVLIRWSEGTLALHSAAETFILDMTSSGASFRQRLISGIHLLLYLSGGRPSTRLQHKSNWEWIVQHLEEEYIVGKTEDGPDVFVQAVKRFNAAVHQISGNLAAQYNLTTSGINGRSVLKTFLKERGFDHCLEAVRELGFVEGENGASGQWKRARIDGDDL